MSPSIASLLCRLVLIAALCSGPLLISQTPYHVHEGGGGNEAFGVSATDLGDVDGDGVADYAFGARRGHNQAGCVRVYSGATGQSLTTIHGQIGYDGDHFGAAIAGVGDLNGDTVPDLLVGAPFDDTYGWNWGRARIYSGSNWSLLREHPAPPGARFGATTASLGDVDGDGVPEYLIGFGSTGGFSEVHCFSGSTGLALWTSQYVDQDRATVLSPVRGDVNADGIPDALIGAPGAPSGLGIISGNFVVALDGATGTELLRVQGGTYHAFGTSVSWLGDLNGDQRDDFAVYSTGVPDSERVKVFDGATGVELHRFSATAPFGQGLLSGIGDQNGDGRFDIAVQHGSYIRLHSGTTGAVLQTYDRFVTGAGNVATALAPGSDLDGDGRQELLHGSPSAGLNGGISVVYSSRTYPLQDLGGAVGGPPFGDPVLRAEGALQGGTALRISLTNAATGYSTFLVLGLSAVNYPFLGGTIVPSPDLVIPVTTGGLLSPTGHELMLTVPPGVPSLSEFYLQYLIAPPIGIAGTWTASNAVQGVFP